MEEDVALRDYLVVLLNKWWIVLLIFGVTMGVAVALSSRLPPQYQARTQLLWVSRTSERLADGSTNMGANLSLDTLSNLATANDLLEEIIEALGFDNPGTGHAMPVEALASMMRAQVKVAERGGTVLPLLTMTVRGGDPVQLQQIANKWAELFIQQNALLFASESARSFDFLQSQYDETQRNLLAKNKEKLAYQKENPVEHLRSELSALTQGVPVPGRSPLFEQFIGDLEKKRVALSAAKAEEGSLSKALKEESPTLRRTRTVSEEVLFRLIESNPGTVDPKTVQALTIVNEEENPVYVFLKEKLSDAATRAAALSAEVTQLEAKTAEFKVTIQDLSERIAQIEVQRSTFDTDIAVLTSNVTLLAGSLQEARFAKEEEASSIRVVESAIVPRVPVGPNRQQFILPAAVSGLVVGVLVALLVHYVQTGSLRAGRGSVSPTKEPAS